MKKKIALIAGGYSGEYIISIASSETIEHNLSNDLYDLYKIIITKDEWYYETKNNNKILVDKNDFSITLDGNKILFDLAFIVLHGTPGEDGKLQGYLDMLHIPYTTCNAITSAVTFNKSFCNKVVKDFDIVHIAKSIHLYKNKSYSLGAVLENISLPVFVKPNESGSSLGVSKVTEINQLLPAIDKAFAEDNEILIEEFIKGRELTIGVYSLEGKVNTLPPTEIVSKNDFFDYEAKYTPGITNEITPAPISKDILEQLQHKASTIYTKLNCRGIVRIDFILQQSSNELYFLEVNTTPGQSKNSLIPQQVAAAGLSLEQFYNSIVEESLRN